LTAGTFIADMEGYFGDSYGPTGQRILGQYLGKLDEGLLPYLYAEALKTVERRYKTAPGVAELEKVKRAARDEMTSDQARKAALASPDRLQITEELMAPEDVAAILGRLAAAKTVDGTGEGV
jgi:hypothetical protein